MTNPPHATLTEEDTMAAKTEALAKQFETKVQEATGVFERLSDADWKKTASEKWTVGVVAHHLAGSHEGISGIIKTVAGGQSIPNFTMDMLHYVNAKHAKEFANVSKAETIALHKKNAAAAAAVVRGLSDADLGKSGTVLTGMPPMSVEQIINAILLGHVEEHLKSIRTAIGA
jgi:DinB superfamily